MAFINSKNKLVQKIKSAWGQPKDSSFDFDLIEHYFRKKSSPSALQVISNRTMNDIDFRSLFSYVDRTNSKIGQQFLFSKLLTIEKSPGFEQQEILIDHFMKNEGQRIKSQVILSDLGDDKSLYVSHLFLEPFVEPPKYLGIIKVLSVLSFLALIATLINSRIFIFLAALLFLNTAIHYKYKKYTELYCNSIPRLILICKCIRGLIKLNLPIKPKDSIFSSLKSIERLKSQMSIFTIEANFNSDIGSSIKYLLSEYIKMFFLLEPIIVFHVLKKLDQKKSDIQNLFEYVGEIDSILSIASLRYGLEYHCMPHIPANDNRMVFTDLYHPLIPNCISNSLAVNSKSILLTGSNMSGKSTFIRAIAINALFAQTINTCFASNFRIAPIKIFSAIRISDDLLSNKSYYFEEVLVIKDMIVESETGPGNLFLLDEIFKGTNAIERIASGKAVLSYLNKGNNVVFVSTHDIELTDLLADSYDLYHFTEVIENSKVSFDYKLKQGYLKSRNAIRILEVNDYPKEIIKEAKEIAEQRSKTLL
ncbi:MAG: DNA mismatch repair protein MutS [Chloroflexi bacterium]|nr:DNA mismatch repair protein MutS [Chloroflexota bacterium]